MKPQNEKSSAANPDGWQRTNVTNLLKNGRSGRYYARVKVNGKEKWRALDTTLFSVAKLKLPDVEKQLRAAGKVTNSKDAPERTPETSVGRFIAAFRTRTENDASLAPATKSRRDISIKALLKTWPDLASRDARRVTPNDCKTWSANALRLGTGFVAPKARTVRKGMSPSAFNKCVEVLKAVFEIARENGVIYLNPAGDVARAKLTAKRLDLPTGAQFYVLTKSVAEAGARQSADCADMVRLLAFSGVRLQEGIALRWRHVDTANNRLTVPGTKSATSYRHIPLVPALASLLTEIRARRAAAGVEEGVEAPILAVNECKGALRTACKAVGVKALTHHDLRHLFATRCIESGIDIPTVSRWLGHSDGGALAMKVYGHLSDKHSQSAALKVAF